MCNAGHRYSAEMQELNTDELELVSGGVWSSGGVCKECTIGTPNGGGPDIYRGCHRPS